MTDTAPPNVFVVSCGVSVLRQGLNRTMRDARLLVFATPPCEEGLRLLAGYPIPTTSASGGGRTGDKEGADPASTGGRLGDPESDGPTNPQDERWWFLDDERGGGDRRALSGLAYEWFVANTARGVGGRPGGGAGRGR